MAFMIVSAGVVFLNPSVRADVMGTLGVVVFGFNTWLVGASLRRSSALVLSDEGISYGLFGHISWAEIDHARLRELGVRSTTIPYIELVLHDPSRYARRAPGTARAVGVVNRVFGYSPVCIPLGAVPVSAQTVMEAMRRYAPGLEVKRSGPEGVVGPC